MMKLTPENSTQLMNSRFGLKINAYRLSGEKKLFKSSDRKKISTQFFYFYREITFENAEELTEEGLPFLILFHAPNDTESIKDFKSIVESQLMSEKRKLF